MKYLFQRGHIAKPFSRAQTPRAVWGPLWTWSCATLLDPSMRERRVLAGPSSDPVLPRPVLGQSERLRCLLEDEASIGECLHDVGNVLAVVWRERRWLGAQSFPAVI